MEMAESSPKGWKTLWEKEKLLVTSNFSLSYSVFKGFVLQTRKNQGLFGKGLKRHVVSEERSLKAMHCLIQVASNTGLTVIIQV